MPCADTKLTLGRSAAVISLSAFRPGAEDRHRLFALQEATIVLAVLMRRFDLNLMPRQAPLSLPDLGPIVGSIAKVRLLPAEPPEPSKPHKVSLSGEPS